MYSAHIVVLFFLCDICFASLMGLMSNLAVIDSSKMEIHHETGSRRGWEPVIPKGPCTFLSARGSGTNPLLFIDFYSNYPLHLIYIKGVSSKKTVSLNVSLDDRALAAFYFHNETEVKPNPVQQGRVLSISATQDVSICSIKVYTCRPGWEGDQCDEKCAFGFYGLACRYRCLCSGHDKCDHVTGRCSSGCEWSVKVGVSQVCTSDTVGVAKEDMISTGLTPVTSIINGPTQTLKSARFHDSSQQCINITTQCDTKFLYLQLSLTNPISLYGVSVTFTKFHVPAPFSMSVTCGDVPCFTLLSHNSSFTLGAHVFKCRRENVTGTSIRLTVTTHNKTASMRGKGVGISACNFNALECSPGFFGYACRKTSQCLYSDYDTLAGRCRRGRCNHHAKGVHCTSIDIIPAKQNSRKYYGSITSRFSPGGPRSRSYFDPNTSYHISWMAVQLDSIYFMHGISLTLPWSMTGVSKPKRIDVYTDTGITATDFNLDSDHEWRGLPCVLRDRDRIHAVSHLICQGLVKTVFVVIYKDEGHTDTANVDIQVWVCVDGTFGVACEHHCNCEDPTEACHKGTGACLSGCASGYKGIDCLEQCSRDDLDPGCPKTCQCAGLLQGECGPGMALCSRGCQDGWMGLDCSLPCPRGYYGLNCDYPCGDCRLDPSSPQSGTCLFTNGTCPLGCAHPDSVAPTCTINDTLLVPRPPWPKVPAIPSRREVRLRAALQKSPIRVIVGLIAVIVACGSVVLMVCCVLKCYWERLAQSKRINEKRVDMIMRRAMRSQMDSKVQSEHQRYHEAYMKRDMLRRIGDSVDQPPPEGMDTKARAKAEAIRRMILEMESQRRLKGVGKPDPALVEADDEDEEQDPNQKVALWILKQDFSELIERRRKRLRELSENPLTMAESSYRISETSLVKDIHKLYDDIEHLAIP